MATGTVSASINVDVKRIVANRLREAGTTANEVIRNLWEHIAATGEIPSFNESAAPEKNTEPEAFRRLMQLRAAVPSNTPLVTMDAAALRAELENRDA